MDTDGAFKESVSLSCSDNMNIKYNNVGVFECNICFDLAQDPVVTLCGHLFCWPCLYKWLQFHSYSHECPVCKALVVEDSLVPIYGRGTSGSDLRVHPASRDDIPSRPASQRPQTAPVPELTYFRQDRSGAGAPWPMAAARLGSLTRTTPFGAISSLLNFRILDFHDMSAYGTTSGGNYLFSSYAHGDYAHGFHQYPIHVQATKLLFLTICFSFLGLLVLVIILASLFWS